MVLGGVVLAGAWEIPSAIGAAGSCSSCRVSRGLLADMSWGEGDTGTGADSGMDGACVAFAPLSRAFFCACIIRSRIRSVQTLEGLREGVVDLGADSSACVVSLTGDCTVESFSFGIDVCAPVAAAVLCFGLDSLSSAWACAFWLAAWRRRSAYETVGADLDVCVVVHANRDILDPTVERSAAQASGSAGNPYERWRATSSRRRMRQGAQLRPA